MIQKNRKEELNENVHPVKELLDEEVDQVNGAGNPFDPIPRVPTQPIDDDMRDKA